MIYSTRACAPVALSHLLGESSGESATRIANLGDDYRAPQPATLHKILENTIGVKGTETYKNKPKFMRWRRGKKGKWLAILGSEWGAHAICLKDGKATDNGFAPWLGTERFFVYGAWQCR